MAFARRQAGERPAAIEGQREQSENGQLLNPTAVTNSAPVAGPTTQNKPGFLTGSVRGRVTATDPDGDRLRFSGSTRTAKGAVRVSASGAFTYVPTAAARHAAAATGAATGAKTDTFTVTVTDGAGGSTSIPVTVTIAGSNTTPLLANARAGRPNISTGVVTVNASALDPDGDTLTYSTPATTAKGTVVNNGGGRFTYTPTTAARNAAAAPGAPASAKSDKLTITVTDGHGGTTTTKVTVHIAPLAAAPNRNPTGGGANVGQPNPTTGTVTGTVTATDPDNDPLTYTGPATSTKGGAVTVTSNGTFTYTPTSAARHAASATNAAAADKTDSFTVTVSDNRGGTLSVPVTVTISATNAAPVGGYTAGQPNSSTGTVTGQVTSTDTDGDAGTYSGPTTSAKGGTVTVTSSGTFTYSPTSAARHAASATNGPATDKTDSFTVTVDDGHGGTVAVPISVTILGKNAAPTGGSANVGTPNPTTGVVTGSVTGVSDTDGDPLTYSAPTTTPKGSVVVNSNGTFTYTPTAAARAAAAQTPGTDSDAFTVTANDGHGGSTAVDVTVTVLPAAVVTSPSTAGAPAGGLIIGATGTRYQVTSSVNPVTLIPAGTRVSVVTSDGRVLSTTDTIVGGISLAQPVARPDGTLVLATYDQPSDTTTVTSVSTSGAATTLGTAQGVAFPMQVAADGTTQTFTFGVSGGTPTYGVLTVSADNTVHSSPIDGVPATLPQLAPDGSAYLVVTKLNTTGTMSTARLMAVAPDGTIRLSPAFATSGAASTGGVVIASDGSAYASFSVPNQQTGTYDTTIVNATATTMTTRTIPNTVANGLLVADGLGAVYQTLQNGLTQNSSGNSVSIAKITAGDITLTPPVPGFATSNLVIGAARTAFVNITDQTSGKNSVLVRLETGEAVTVVIPGDVATYLPGSGGMGTIITTGGTAHTYVPYTKTTEDGLPQAYVAVIDFLGTVSQSSVTLPAGVGVGTGVVFNSGIPYTPYQVVINIEDGTTSVVNLTTGANTAPVPGEPYTGAETNGSITKPVYFAPNGYGYLITTDGSGSDVVLRVQQFNDTTPTGGGFTGVSEPGAPVLTPIRVTSATSAAASPIVFAPGGAAYVTIQNGTFADAHPSVTVYEITPSGSTKLLDEEDAIGSPVTVAPDGTVYVSIGKLNAAGDDYVTTVRVVHSSVIL